MSDEEIVQAYKPIYDIVIPDLDYYIRQIDCRDGCPVNTDPSGYMIALHAGNYLGRVQDRPRAQSLCFHLRGDLRRAMRTDMPTRSRRQNIDHPGAKAIS